MIVLGIDPGQKGAVCLQAAQSKEPVFIDMPVLKNRKANEGMALDADTLANRIIRALTELGDDGEAVAYVEEQHVFHQKANSRGIKSFFADFGGTLAVLQCIGVPYELVKPTTWQALLKKPATKEGSIWLAQRLYPNAELVKPGCRTLSDGRADALLICEYGLRMEKVSSRGRK